MKSRSPRLPVLDRSQSSAPVSRRSVIRNSVSWGRGESEAEKMRPRLVLFGDSITEQSFSPGGWGAALAEHFARQVNPQPSPSPRFYAAAAASCCGLCVVCRPDIGIYFIFACGAVLIRRMWCCAGSAGTTRGGR